MAIKTHVKPDPILEEGGIPLSAYWRPVKLRKWLILLLIIVSCTTTFLIISQNVIYQASTTITLSPAAAAILKTPAAINHVATSDSLIKKVIAEGQLKSSVTELQNNVRAQTIAGSQIINIIANDPRPGNAKKIATLVTKNFLTSISKFDPDKKKTLLQLKELRETLALFDTKAAKTELENQRPELVYQKISIIALKMALFNQEETLSTKLTKQAPSQIIGAAVRPNKPIGPPIATRLFFSALAAFIAGAGLAIAFRPAGNEVTV